MKIKHITLIIFILLASLSIFALDLSVSGNDISFISVSVTGAVKNPGIYKIPPDSRLSIAIKKAQHVQQPVSPIILNANDTPQNNDKNDTNYSDNTTSSNRIIYIYRKDKKITVDLQKFFQLGDLTANPYLKDGDVIFVPAAKNFVYISGEVNSPNRYEILPTDRLSDVIELAMGLKTSAFLDSIFIYRYKKDQITFDKIIVNYNNVLSNKDSQQNIILQDGDRIFVRTIPNFHQDCSVEIEGEIRYPGAYPIEKSKTTLLDIIAKAGSPTNFADLKNALLIRLPKDNEYEQDAEFGRLKLISISEMNHEEYEYFKAKSRLLNGLIDVDFDKLWKTKNPKYDITLKNGDKIYIPDNRLTVEVLGQIKNPGKYSFIDGKDYFYYIQQANGLALRANKRKIRIIKYKSGTWEKPKDTKIEPGDKIFIPEKPRYDYVKITKDFLQILTSVATLYFMSNSLK